MAENCIFCQIVAKKGQAKMVFQDDQVTAFEDQRPAAPVHVLIVPNRHIASLNDVTAEDEALLGHIATVASRLAKELGIRQSGYRLVLNTGPDAGQTVFHLHAHLMGGRPLAGLSR